MDGIASPKMTGGGRPAFCDLTNRSAILPLARFSSFLCYNFLRSHIPTSHSYLSISTHHLVAFAAFRPTDFTNLSALIGEDLPAPSSTAPFDILARYANFSDLISLSKLLRSGRCNGLHMVPRKVVSACAGRPAEQSQRGMSLSSQTLPAGEQKSYPWETTMTRCTHTSSFCYNPMQKEMLLTRHHCASNMKVINARIGLVGLPAWHYTMASVHVILLFSRSLQSTNERTRSYVRYTDANEHT